MNAKHLMTLFSNYRWMIFIIFLPVIKSYMLCSLVCTLPLGNQQYWACGSFFKGGDPQPPISRRQFLVGIIPPFVLFITAISSSVGDCSVQVRMEVSSSLRLLW